MILALPIFFLDPNLVNNNLRVNLILILDPNPMNNNLRVNLIFIMLEYEIKHGTEFEFYVNLSLYPGMGPPMHVRIEWRFETPPGHGINL